MVTESRPDGAVVTRPETPEELSLRLTIEARDAIDARDLEKAEGLLWHALALHSTNAEAWHHTGLIARLSGLYTSASVLMGRATEIDPDNAAYWCNFGECCSNAGRLADAEAAYAKALAGDPRCPQTLNNLGVLLMKLDRLDESEDRFLEAIRLKPDFSAAHLNLCKLYLQNAQQDAATRHALIAVGNDPDKAEARWNLSLCQLRTGNLRDGWRNYEARWALPFFRRNNNTLPGNRWQGEDLAGKTIAVVAEQGMGDTVQFIRYAADLKARGAAKVIAVVQTQLGSLIRTVPGVDEVLTGGEDEPTYDHWSPLLSLPLLLDVDDYQRVTWPGRYVLPDNGWAADATDEPQIGICWAGSRDHANDRYRSIAVADLEPLADVKAGWWNLQFGEKPPAWVRYDPMIEVKDMLDTAKVIEQLDLIVTCDTAVAHVAGAMGKPVIVLLPVSSDWRWMLDRDDTPWYPTMRLVRQHPGEPWRNVVRRVAEQLAPAIAEVA